MKRTMSDVVGRPLASGYRRDFRHHDVAGVRRQASALASALDVASFRDAFGGDRFGAVPVLANGLDDPMGTAESDVELMADFADFMAGAADFERGEAQPPDPRFRDQLRRRLWRTHVLVNLRDGGETH